MGRWEKMQQNVYILPFGKNNVIGEIIELKTVVLNVSNHSHAGTLQKPRYWSCIAIRHCLGNKSNRDSNNTDGVRLYHRQVMQDIHFSKHLWDQPLDFGYFHPPKEFSNGQNIMLLSNDLSICTLMLISNEAQDAKQTREKLNYP